MKISSVFPLFCLAALPLNAGANDILVYKCTRVTTYVSHTADDPDSASPFGYPPFTGKITETSYAVVDLSAPREAGSAPGTVQLFSLETSAYPVDAYDAGGGAAASRKIFTVDPPAALSETFQKLQPLKSGGALLWNGQYGEAGGIEGNLSRYQSFFVSEQLIGATAPLALSKTLTIQNVPRTLTGSGVIFWHEHTPAEDGDPPYVIEFSGTTSSTWTLDTALSKAANTLPVTGTADLDTLSSETDYVGQLAAGRLENGVQRVRNLIYATGYRLARDADP